MNTEELVMDVGTVLDGSDAVKEGLIDGLGSLSDALECLYEMIDNNKEDHGYAEHTEEHSSVEKQLAVRSSHANTDKKIKKRTTKIGKGRHVGEISITACLVYIGYNENKR